MKKIAPIRMEFKYVGGEESTRRMKRAYDRLFRKAYQEILDLQSTHKYTNINEQLSNTGGSSRDVESQENNGLSDGQGRQDSSDQVWESMESGQRFTGSKVKERNLKT